MDVEMRDLVYKLRGQIFELENRVDFLYKKLNMDYIPENVDTIREIDPRIVEALKKGNMMEAIKIYREITHTDFAAAKSEVEAMWAKYK